MSAAAAQRLDHLPRARDLPEAVMCTPPAEPAFTGAWRHLRPEHQPATAPCRSACPLANDIEGFVSRLAEGSSIDAWRLIVPTNPLPAVCGRVCFKPCEAACARNAFDQGVAIRDLERVAGDSALGQEVALPEARPGVALGVAVVGSGPAGLGCAYHLARLGYHPTIFEAREKPGGLLRYGIPEYRLPEKILDGELARLLACGIELRPRMSLGSDFELGDLSAYAAVFLAIGRQAPKPFHLPLPFSHRILPATRFLAALKRGAPLPSSQRVVVIGGGSAAIDAARSALRLGARVTLCCLEERTRMPADAQETRQAEREGVTIEERTAVREVALGEDGGILLALGRVASFSLGAAGASIDLAGGSERLLLADLMVVAAGQTVDWAALAGIDTARSSRGEGPAEGSPGPLLLFGGDLARALFSPAHPATVADALASGMRAARTIHQRLARLGPDEATPPTPAAIKPGYFAKSERQHPAELALAERLRGFAEVSGSLSPQAAASEAGRCFHCGRCSGCDNCRIFCPDLAVHIASDRQRYEIDYDHCKGCGICVEECPRGAIHLVEERR